MVTSESASTFIGRSSELEDLQERIAVRQHRLVTVVGPGGVGKTRLAQESTPADVVWVSLVAVSDVAHVPQAIARAMDRQIPDTVAPWQALEFMLADTHLLVLDNLEQIPAIGDSLELLLQRVPQLNIIATSRVALHVPSEFVLKLTPLALDTSAENPSAAALMFVDSAQRVRPRFAPNPDDLVTINELCQRLDGLPLSIDIAAAQVRLMSPQAILSSLGDYPDHLLNVLAHGDREGDTLASTIARSYALFDPPCQQLFRRLALATGGVTPALANALVDNPSQTLEFLGTLVDHHVLEIDAQSSQPRFRMLETIRAYAAALLAADSTQDDARRRLAESLTAMAAQAGRERDFAGGRERISAVDVEWDTIRSLMPALIARQPEVAVALMDALEAVVFARGHVAEAWTWAEQLLDTPAGVKLTLLAARLARMQGMLTQAEELIVQDRKLVTTDREIAWLDYELGTIRRQQRRFDDARELFTRAEHVFVDSGDHAATLKVRNGLGCVEMDTGRFEDATHWFESGLALARETRAILDESRITLNYGYLATVQGYYAQAVLIHESCIPLCEASGDLGNTAMNYVNLAGALIALRRWDEAERYELAAVPLLRSLGNIAGEAWTLSGRVAIARGRGDTASESRLLTELIGMRRILGDTDNLAQNYFQLARNWQEVGDDLRAEAALQEGAPFVPAEELAFYEAAIGWHRGEADSEQRIREALVALHGAVGMGAVGRALQFLADSADDTTLSQLATNTIINEKQLGQLRVPPVPTSHPLTSREMEVLRLVVAGKTDRQIAEVLFVSTRTVGFHVSNILHKLALNSRAEAAAWAARNLKN